MSDVPARAPEPSDDLPVPPDHEAEDGWFWSEVDQSRICWLWTGYVAPNGYGHVRQTTAHRVAWEITYGPIPPKHDIDHLCRERSCVRPSHLEPVTRSENMRRGIGPTVLHRKFQAQRTCKHGHPFDQENTYMSPAGRRMCRTCMRDASREYQRRRTQKASA